MRIVYVANHKQHNSNDDEGAITYALQQLGHEVIPVMEKTGKKCLKLKPDFFLFHKWSDFEAISRIQIPKVFWYFDLVDWPGDESLRSRCNARIGWMKITLSMVDLGFCTDGDWVRSATIRSDTVGLNAHKLIWLPQGADERVAGTTPNGSEQSRVPILFTGIGHRGGVERINFVHEMREKYGDKFTHIPSGVYGASLRDLIARTDIVVCPDSPITDHYWSNRVYMAAGFGAFLLHPYTEGLEQHYTQGTDLDYYRSREELHRLIRFYNTYPSARVSIARQAQERTLREHTYRHRCAQLIETVKEKLKI